MKKFLKWLIGLIEIIIIIYVICITTCLLAKNKYGFTQLGNTTLITINEHLQEFLPETKVKDLLIVKGNPKDVINVGEKIYYYGTHNEEYVIQSGYVKEKITDDNTNALYVLNDEKQTKIPSTRTIGKYSNTYASIGGILDILESRLGFLLLVLLPILIIFIYQIYALIIVVKYTDYEDDDKKEKQKKKKTKEEVQEQPKQEVQEPKKDTDIEVL